MTLTSWERLRRAERAFRARWFPERQLILREGDRVRALRLHPAFQMAVAGAVVCSGLWTAGATIAYLVDRDQVAVARAETERMRVAYAQVIDEVSQQQSRVLDITQNLEHYRSYLLTLLEQNQNLRRDLRAFASQLEVPEGESQRTAAAEEALRGQLQDMARDLVGVSHRNELLQSDVSQLRSRVSGEDERARFAAARAALDRRMARLEQDATGAHSRVQELERALVAKQQLVDQAQAGRRAAITERDQLAARVAPEREQLTHRAVEAEERLQTATKEHEQAVARLVKEHEQALTKLSDQARSTISEVERIVSAAGLDSKRLVPNRTDSRSRQNRGGPFVPWSATRRSEPDKPGSETTEALHYDIARLDDLRKLLRALPLGAPVKDFSITSTFGYRSDPFNNLGALHTGLDMQAPMRSRVTAPAAGKVVFSGWNAAYGRMLEIEHGYGLRTRYAHLDRIEVAEGVTVNAGQLIGLVGASGRTSGIHLHYEVLVDGKPRNPMPFLQAVAEGRKAGETRKASDVRKDK